MNKPTLKQQEIIDYTGKLLVIAPPGSGKTYTLTKKIEKVQKQSRKKIIVLTFSNKAAVELQNRIADKTNVLVNTIHGFCQEIVLSRGYQIGLPKNLRILANEREKLFVIKNVINESSYLSSNIKDFSEENLTKISKFISKQKSKFIPPEYYKNKESKFSKLYYEVYDGYVNNMLQQRLIDFEDLLYYSYKILNLRETKSLFSRLYGHLYVDEAQDLNITQYEIIKLVANLVNDVMLIGDPSQSLYGFIGSSKDIMEKIYVKDFSPKIIEINENFRSASRIVQLINELNNENKSLSQFPIEGEVQFTLYENEQEEAKEILKKILELENEGTPLEEIAILGRNIYLHNEIKKLFTSENILYNSGVVSELILESDEANIFINIIRLIDNPNNEIVKNYFSKYYNLVDSSFVDIHQKVKENHKVIFEAVNKITKNVNLFMSEVNKLIEHYKTVNLVDEYKYLLLNDFDLLKTNWVNYSIQRSENKNLSSFINDMNLGKTGDVDLKGVSLLTVHKSKGLEYDTTFVIGLNEGVLPDYRATEKNMSEEDNNAYVAFSRAKRRCYISSTKFRMMPWGTAKKQTISRYIKKVSSVLQ